MGRKRIHENDNARKREYNKTHKHSGKSGKRHTKSRNGFFVSWDGEGRDTSELLPNKDVRPKLADIDGDYNRSYVYEEIAASDRAVYRHEMNIFAYASERGATTRYEDRRLTTSELLAFIGEGFRANGPLAIHVSFSFSYDVTHILYDLPREEAIKALSERRRKLSDYGRYGPYLIKYRPRKQLYVAKLRNLHAPYKIVKGEYKLDLEWSGTIYDTFGFFQCGFLAALKLWGVGTAEELDTIQKGKEGRAEFAAWNAKEIILYNMLELQLLNKLMERLRSALIANNLYLHRWDGAGAVASAVYNKELPRDYMREIVLPEAVEIACYHAYAGGRIECIQQGTYNDLIYRYDINSAYPAAMARIPDLHKGHWSKADSVEEFGLYLTRWSFPDKMPFYPFFYRTDTGGILFPQHGYNWLWGCEILVARAAGLGKHIEIEQGYVFKYHSDASPFNFIERYYQQRSEIKQRLKNDTAHENDYGTSLVIKLGLNSLYGKTIQKVGARMIDDTIVLPPYYNIAVGSFITAYTRAKLFSLAMQSPESIILFATDGILSTQPLNADIGSGLGQWEADTAEGLVILGAGIYWTKEKGQWKEKSRGIDKSSNASEEHRTMVQCGWKLKQETVEFPLRNFIGLKYASLTEERYTLRGVWIHRSKLLKLWSAGTKRTVTPYTKRPHKQLYRTSPFHLDPWRYAQRGIYELSTPRPEPKVETEEDIEE